MNASNGACGPLPGNPAVEPAGADFLPDGKHFLYRARRHASDTGVADPTGIYVGSLDRPPGKRLLPDDSTAVYAQGLDGRGFLVFVRDGALVGQEFDAGSLSLSGDVFKISDDASFSGDGGMMASAAPGVLVYGTGRNVNTQLTWMDREGKVLSTLGSIRDQEGVAISSDGRQLALTRDFGSSSNADLWLRDVAHEGETRLTSSPSGGLSGVWSPDGKMMAFSSRDFNLYRRDVLGSGKEEILLKNDAQKWASDWSHDGRYLLFTQAKKNSNKAEIWVLPNPGGSPGEPWPFEQRDADTGEAQLSPDGRWVAYTMAESGMFEVYVRPFPSGPGRWKVPDTLAAEPRWRSDGKELYYLTIGTLPRWRLMAVPVNAGPGGSFSFGEPHMLFEPLLSYWVPSLNLWSYAPSPDGKRFIALVKPDVPEAIHVLTNWTRMFMK